jgi:hypothetical protein
MPEPAPDPDPEEELVLDPGEFPIGCPGVHGMPTATSPVWRIPEKPEAGQIVATTVPPLEGGG